MKAPGRAMRVCTNTVASSEDATLMTLGAFEGLETPYLEHV